MRPRPFDSLEAPHNDVCCLGDFSTNQRIDNGQQDPQFPLDRLGDSLLPFWLHQRMPVSGGNGRQPLADGFG
jgi:hypothetical protein